MPEKCDDKVRDIVRRLAGYVDVNPLACDTPTGIARWWLQIEFEDEATVQQALDWMTAHGLMEKLVAADGRFRYRRIGTAERFASELASLR
jgi:hypothetical protein